MAPLHHPEEESVPSEALSQSNGCEVHGYFKTKAITNINQFIYVEANVLMIEGKRQQDIQGNSHRNPVYHAKHTTYPKPHLFFDQIFVVNLTIMD